MLRSAARVHLEAVRTSLFDALNTEQQAALREISETLVAHLLASPLQSTAESRRAGSRGAGWKGACAVELTGQLTTEDGL